MTISIRMKYKVKDLSLASILCKFLENIYKMDLLLTETETDMTSITLAIKQTKGIEICRLLFSKHFLFSLIDYTHT